MKTKSKALKAVKSNKSAKLKKIEPPKKSVKTEKTLKTEKVFETSKPEGFINAKKPSKPNRTIKAAKVVSTEKNLNSKKLGQSSETSKTDKNELNRKLTNLATTNKSVKSAKSVKKSKSKQIQKSVEVKKTDNPSAVSKTNKPVKKVISEKTSKVVDSVQPSKTIINPKPSDKIKKPSPEPISNEIWKTLTDVPKYEISNAGRIRIKKENKIITPSFHKDKDCFILAVKQKDKNNIFAVHRLVAKVFIPNPENLKFVIHKNNDKRDNRVENLIWSDHIDRLRQNSSISNEEEKIIKDKLRKGVTGAELALEYNTSEMSISRINKKLMKDLTKELRDSPGKVISSLPSTQVKSLADIDWFAFSQNTLMEEKALLTASDFIDLAIEKYSLTDVDRLKISNQLTTVLNKLILLKVLKKYIPVKKQRFYYGFANWFTTKSTIKREYQKKYLNTIEKQIERAKEHKNIHLMKMIYETLNDQNKVLTVDEFVKEALKRTELKKKNENTLKKQLLEVLEEMVKKTMLNKQPADDDIFWYGFASWWFKKDMKLKSVYTGL